MLDIRPVSDLRNRFSEIEAVAKEGVPVFLTKNGYGTMVVLSIEQYTRLSDPVEFALDQADYLAETDKRRLSHEEVFGEIRKKIDGKK